MIEKTFRGNPNLKRVGEKISFTQHQAIEYAKCSRDPVYFLENYGKIVSLDDGIVPFKLFGYQKKIIRAIKDNRLVLTKMFRQSGKSTTVAGFIAWYCMFNKNKISMIMANKQRTAQEIFSRVQFIVSNCPKWLQQGVREWNKTSFELENGSKVSCAATSADAVRGSSINFLLLDEFAFLSPNLAEEFVASVFPTISSSKKSKMVIVSTPKGMNHYWKLWVEAQSGQNGFKTIETTWQEHPHRDQKWADEQRAILGEVKYNQEILTQFIGSSATLISGAKLQALPSIPPLMRLLPNSDSLLQYHPVQSGHSYVMTVDVSRGSDLDYSTFTVIDISVMPYEVACIYRNNSISTLVYPEIIYKIANLYNQAFVLVETNDLGQQVADALFYDFEYENVYMSHSDNIKEGGVKTKPGFRTTKKTKAIGCDMLKGLVENDKLMVNDAETISELTTFIRVGTSYKADEGKHDDLVMCLVMFGYLTSQPVFQELFDFSLREKFFEQQIKEVDDQMLPLGFFERGGGEEVVQPASRFIGGWQENKDESWDALWR